MAEEFGGVGRLKKLKEDAALAAAAIEAATQESVETANCTAVIELSSPRPTREPHATDATVASHPEPLLHPVTLSTLVRASTKKRLARAAHLQAATEQVPSTQWEIVDEAINEWCRSRGY